MHQAICQVSVVGQDNEAFTVFIESAGAKQALVGELFGEEVEDGAGIVRVVVAADKALRFIDGEDDLALVAISDSLALEDNLIRFGIDFIANLSD